MAPNRCHAALSVLILERSERPSPMDFSLSACPGYSVTFVARAHPQSYSDLRRA